MLNLVFRRLMVPNKWWEQFCTQCRNVQTANSISGSYAGTRASTIMAWQISDYGGINSIKMTSTAPKPMIRHPNDVLIKILAASMNQIDRRMTEGYGHTVVSTLKTVDTLRYSGCTSYSVDEFPITLGRDCSGVVEAVGAGVRNIQPGDEVFAAVPVERQGCHAEYVVTPSTSLALKPATLSHIEAASIPYAALTAYAAIRKVGGVSRHGGSSSGANINTLVIGGSGGVGLSAIQLLRASAQVVNVTATCNHDAVDLLYGTGCDLVVDYSAGDVWQQIRDTGTLYDVVIDLVGHQSHRAVEVLRPWSGARYVTVVSPLLSHTDQLGLAAGLARTATSAIYDTLYGLQVGSSYRWAFFMPDGAALTEIGELVSEGRFRAVIDQVYKFSDVHLAYERLRQKHLRGKLVVDVSGGETKE